MSSEVHSTNETIAPSWWDSRLAQRLHLALAALVAVVVICLVFDEGAFWIFAFPVFIVVAALPAFRWPYGALGILIGLSAMPVYFIEIAGWKARPEHFAAMIVLAAIALWQVFGTGRIRWNQLDYWIVAFVAINFISSAFGSIAPASTLRWALQNTIAILAYFLIRALITDRETLQKAYGILLAVTLAESLFGIFCFVAHQLFGSTLGMTVGQYFGTVAAPNGSMYEPNLFGAYAACGAVLFLARFLSGQSKRNSGLGLLVTSLATFLSYSRAALLALILVSLWVFWKNRHLGGNSKLLAPLLALGIILLIAVTAAGSVLRERFENLYYEGLTDETALVRFIILQDALQEIPSHPILGTGTASFNLSFDWNQYLPALANDKTWIGNLPVRIVHDTGLLGMGVIVGFFVSVWRRARPALKHLQNSDSILLGLIAGMLLYGISFQFTDGSILAFFWVHLGFLASAAILRHQATSPMGVAMATPPVPGSVTA